ncbi:TPA: MFS transporter [Enterobacter asburiae]
MLSRKKSDKKSKWYILAVIILMYLPVSLDATILHVAAPLLSIDLKASADEVLWIIDIYSLVMASFLLVMGVVGDKIGAKKLAIMGVIIFGLASFIAMISTTAMILIIARGVLAIGAAMILPATLSALRISFSSNKERAVALGIWSAVGTGGAALGPVVGGLLLEKYSWGSVFFINIPVCILVLVMALKLPDLKTAGAKRKISISDPLLLIASILLIILSVKTSAREGFSPQLLVLSATGISLIAVFLHRQKSSENPMLQLSFFRNKTIVAGIILALASMVSLVGFEFYVSQQLQLAYGKTPLQAGLFLLPLILASCLSGPFIGWTLDRTGIRLIAVGGVVISAASFAGMAFTSFDTQIWNAWLLMVVLGFCIEAALLASTTAIMNAVPANKAGEAGAIEGMAYELGAGIGVVFFGLLMASTFRNNLHDLQPGYDNVNITGIGSSLSEAFSYAATLPQNENSIVRDASITAFLNSHSTVMLASSFCLTLLGLCIYILLKDRSSNS